MMRETRVWLASGLYSSDRSAAGTGPASRAGKQGRVDRLTDSILLEGMQFYAYHGVNPEERALGQRFLVDVELQADLRVPGRSDDLADTISYSDVYKRVRDIVTGQPRDLIEAVAHEIALGLLREFPAQVVTVTVRKPEAPLRGAMLDAAGVRVTRYRDELEE